MEKFRNKKTRFLKRCVNLLDYDTIPSRSDVRDNAPIYLFNKLLNELSEYLPRYGLITSIVLFDPQICNYVISKFMQSADKFWFQLVIGYLRKSCVCNILNRLWQGDANTIWEGFLNDSSRLSLFHCVELVFHVVRIVFQSWRKPQECISKQPDKGTV